MRRKACSCVVWTLAVLVCTVAAVRAGEVRRIRYSIDAERTRVVLDTDKRVDYTVARHNSPERLSINLRGTTAPRSLRSVDVGRGGVMRIRINRLSWGTQIVVDLTSAADWNDFRLASGGSKSDRIVIDLSAATAVSRPVTTVSSPPRSRLIVVAVDPGHGGKDPGAVGRYNLVEKKMTLDMARRVRREINKRDGFKAVLTRTRDEYLTLPRRTEIASQAGADVFVSIHFNTARNRAARGTEIYFVSPSGAARSASAVLANPERAADQYGLGEADDDILHMLVDMNQQSVLARSEALGESILRSMNRPGLLPTRSVKQKSFSVLRTIEMPSVLVEVGFISNSSDATLIRKETGRDELARAISNGVIGFLRANPPSRGERDKAIVHRVRRGDTLWKISRKYDTSVASLRQSNQLGRSSVLRVGQELVISGRY